MKHKIVVALVVSLFFYGVACGGDEDPGGVPGSCKAQAILVCDCCEAVIVAMCKDYVDASSFTFTSAEEKTCETKTEAGNLCAPSNQVNIDIICGAALGI